MVVDDSDATSEIASEADYAEAARRYARSALNPLIDRVTSQELLDSVSKLAETTDPANMHGFKLFSKSHTGSTAIRDAVAAALAARDAADKAEPRRAELNERLNAVLAAIKGCVNQMGVLERARNKVQTVALAEGFVINPDGSTSIPNDAGHTSDQLGGDLDLRRARLEHQIMVLFGEVTQLQDSTVATIRERLGADVPGMPWAILECARGGYDLGEIFGQLTDLPPSPFTTLMHELVTYAAQAKATVWPYPDEDS